MRLPGADKAAKAPRLAETSAGPRYMVTPSHSQKERWPGWNPALLMSGAS
jgi:hypothetical protein